MDRAHSPPTKGVSRGCLKTLQDRLVKELRLAESTASRERSLFEMRFVPEWSSVFTVAPRMHAMPIDDWGAKQHLERNLGVAWPAELAQDHTVSWTESWGVCGKKFVRGFVSCGRDRTAVGRKPWLRYRGRYLHLRACQNRCGRPQVLPAYAPDLRTTPNPKTKSKPKYHVPANHPWRKHGSDISIWRNPDISTLR